MLGSPHHNRNAQLRSHVPGVFRICKSNYTTDALAKNVRLHYYQTRSQQECQHKIEDVAGPWHLEQKRSSWRKDVRGGGGCKLGLYSEIDGFTQLRDPRRRGLQT